MGCIRVCRQRSYFPKGIVAGAVEMVDFELLHPLVLDALKIFYFQRFYHRRLAFNCLIQK
jgi:hypothetical protein